MKQKKIIAFVVRRSITNASKYVFYYLHSCLCQTMMVENTVKTFTSDTLLSQYKTLSSQLIKSVIFPNASHHSTTSFEVHLSSYNRNFHLIYFTNKISILTVFFDADLVGVPDNSCSVIGLAKLQGLTYYNGLTSKQTNDS